MTDASTLPDGISACLDQDHVRLPFFDDRHRDLADRVRSWLGMADQEIVAALDAAPDGAGLRLARLLGRGGWFAALAEGGPDLREVCLLREAFAYRHDLLDFAFSIQCLAAAPIALWGSEAQKAAFLPGLASGESIGAFAVSERCAGSDLAAAVLPARRDGAGFLLDGEKNWVAHAGIADRHLVLARTSDMTGPLGLSMFVVDAMPGLSVVPVPMVAPRAFGHLRFDACRVEDERLIGQEGAGLAVALDVIERYRVSVGAAAVGFARRALHEARRHVRARRTRTGQLSDLPAIRRSLAEMAVAIETAQLAVARAAHDIDRGTRRGTLRSGLSKLYATEAAQRVVDACVQLHGAAGLVAGSTPERLYREVRSLRIYEGASEVQTALIGEAVTNGLFG
ncbi:acyl-CoA dehydrogenase family protein [uncultured Methylobacterium sp.]|uniref:acyl-CoA dehydrogenase family protein n=1 Tax=uncultured Methylobacterium sp. TaxID=157278 RepID=UPI002596843F|nr:acyl-CoA dehydrogenase family protein [uncultured Methylobacterium sp.]